MIKMGIQLPPNITPQCRAIRESVYPKHLDIV
jgi:hypothetical protein